MLGKSPHGAKKMPKRQDGVDKRENMMKTIIAGLITIFVLVQVAYVFDLWPFAVNKFQKESTLSQKDENGKTALQREIETRLKVLEEDKGTYGCTDAAKKAGWCD